MQYRQGDIFIESVSQIPKSATPHTSRIVAYGEVTGHKHQVVEDYVDMFIDSDGHIWASSSKPWSLTHDEHDPIEFAPGIYCLSRQREYDPVKEEHRIVAD